MRVRAVALAVAVAVVLPVAAGDLAGANGRTPLPGPLAVAPQPSETAPASELTPTFEDQVIVLVNQERWAHGQLPPLSRCALLDVASETHSTNMASRDFFAHCDPDTHTLPWDRMVAAGYAWSSVGENIAAGYSTPAAVMAGWLASAGHRANILSTGFREIGVGYAHDPGDLADVRLDQNGDCIPDAVGGPYVHYWTQSFGRRTEVYPVVIDREACQTDTVTVDLYLYGAGWADEMRIRNSGGAWTAWQPFAADVSWQLAPGPGVRQVNVEVRSGATVRSASDTIVSTAAGDIVFADGFESGGTGAWSSAVP